MVDAVLATAARSADGALRKFRVFLCFCCIVLGLCGASSFAADAPDGADLRRAEAAATEAKVFFKAGLFDKASAKFMEAYAISKRPSLMYNAARAYEEGLNYREAVALLKHYRDLPDVGDDGKRDADERIARMDAILRQQAADEAKKAELARLEAERIAAERREKLAAERAERERIERERAEAAARLPVEATPVQVPVVPVVTRHLSWPLLTTTIGVGVLSVAAYGEAYYEASQARQMTIVDGEDVNTYLSHASDAKTFQTVAIVGAVLTAGFASWTVLDWWYSGANSAEKSPAKAAVSVFPAAGGGMLSLRGSF